MPRSKRKESAPPPVITLGPLTIDRDRALFTRAETVVQLTPKESLLLWTLMAHANQVMSRADLMHHVWQTDYVDDTRTLEVHIHWLRKKIEPDPRHPAYLHTMRGQGYVFIWPAPDDPAPMDDLRVAVDD